MDYANALQGGDGWAPVRIYRDTRLEAGDVLGLVSVSGNSIGRIYPDESSNVSGVTACPARWRLYLRRADGTIAGGGVLDNTSFAETGLVVPESGVTALIGYRDGAPDGYFDNEGIRRTTSNQSTGGCTFVFSLRQVRCP